MRSTRRALALLTLVALPLAAAEPRPSLAPADRDALAEIVAESGVVAVPEAPSFAAYARDLGDVVMEWIADLLERLAPDMDAFVVEAARVGAGLIFAVALALLAVLVFRVLRGQLARRRRGEAAVTVAGGTEAQRPRLDWAGELRRRLAAGEVAAACEALWWWLAQALAGDAVAGSWTSRELLARTGRRDLAAPVRRLERMTYGAAAPAVDDVRRLWREFEEALG